MPPQERVFNNRARKVFRSRISNGELYFSAGFLVFVFIMGGWFAAQGTNYDPTERDISMALMESGSVEDNLYRTPLKLWVDPEQTATAAPGAAPAANLGIFPPDIVGNGWTPSSRMQEFDASNLYEKINGQAPQYVDFGFNRLHYISLEKKDAGLDLSIEFYDMATLPNAMGIFGAQRDVERPLEQTGDAYYYLTDLGALGIAGPFYFKISGNAVDPGIIEKSKELAESFGILASSGNVDVPKAFAVLSKALKVPFETIIYEKIDVFQFSFAKDFWFGKPDVAGDLRYYLHQVTDTEDQARLYADLVSNFEADHDAIKNDGGVAVLKHQFLSSFQALSADRGWIFGADGAPDAETAESALSALKGALFNGQEI
ncbi:MAG: hypothetical protein HYV27_14260 [Candidatus Hydrogenedentes bacterium]|nr:hypothetical protein [Candidatus Hydrogenedentota bacterium]